MKKRGCIAEGAAKNRGEKTHPEDQGERELCLQFVYFILCVLKVF